MSSICSSKSSCRPRIGRPPRSLSQKKEMDPDNRLLSRGPRFRMDAEMVRDYALAASGLLVHKIGGPSVKPYQPPGVWEAIAMNVSDTRSYQRDSGENLYRRSLYTFWKRMAPPASLEIMNAPAREYCVVRRERTNTPLQALVTLNDEQFVEAARHLAQQVMLEGGSDVEERLRLLGLTPPRSALPTGGSDDHWADARPTAGALSGPFRRREEPARGGGIASRPGARCGGTGSLDDAGKSTDEYGRSAEQVRRSARFVLPVGGESC